MLFKIAFIANASPNAAPSGSLNFDLDGRTVKVWVTDIRGKPAPTLTLVEFEANTVSVLGDVTGQGTVDVPWSYPAPGLASTAVDVEASLVNGESPDASLTGSETVPASFWNSGITYTEAVTATDSETEEGHLNRLVTSPAHLAAYDAGRDTLGLFEITQAGILDGPQILYPGLVAISAPDPGGEITLTHAPWAAGNGGTITIAYRVMNGATELATSLPYDTTSRDPGELIEVFADISDDNGSRTVKMGDFTLAENPTGPLLSEFTIDYEANTISFNSDSEATVRLRRYQIGYEFTNQAAEVWAGTGATGSETNEFSAVTGPNTFAPAFTGGLSGAQAIYAAARVGSGPISNIIGGPVNITPAGSVLASPKFRGSSFGGSATAVSGVAVPLPAYQSGDLVTLPIAINCAADRVAGISATGPNGEIATVKQALTDDGIAGADGKAVALLYYRATAANTSGSVQINITPGGARNTEEITCAPNVRYDVKASGDPFAQVLKTFSSSAPAGPVYDPFTIRTVSLDPADYDTVIENNTYTATADGTQFIRRSGASEGNTLIRNCTFDGNGFAINGIDLRNTSNVVIYNCTFRDMLVDSNGVRASSSTGNSTDNCAVIGCTFTNIRGDGISFPQREEDGVLHTNVLIKDNILTDCGYRGGPTHAIYTQGPDHVIVGNTIRGRTGGNAISYRSSGLIADNDIEIDQTADAFATGIKYFSDHQTGPTKNLTIANNRIVGLNGALRNGIEIRRNETSPGWTWFVGAGGVEQDWHVNTVRIFGNTITGPTNQSIAFLVSGSETPYQSESWFTYLTTPVALSGAFATSALTAVSAASRLEAVMLSDTTSTIGTAPSGWFMRESGVLGPQALQLMSRNVTVAAAGEVIPAVTFGATAQPWVGLTWELLPLGA